MNFPLATVFVSLLFVITTSAAPSTSDVLFEEVVNADSFQIRDLVSDWPSIIKCLLDVMDQEVNDEFVEKWNVAKAEIDHLNTVWGLCLRNPDSLYQSVCKANVISKSVDVIKDFIKQLAEVFGEEKIVEIHEKLNDKCIEREDSYVLSDDVDKLANSSLPDQFQCFVDVIGDVSIKNGLGELWSKSQPLLQLHLDNWQRCKNIENKFLNLLCNAKEGAVTFQLLNDYVRLVAVEKPIVLISIFRGFQQQCNQNETSLVDLLNFDDIEQLNVAQIIIEKIKCILNATTAALMDVNYLKPLEDFRKELEELSQRLNECNKKPTHWEKTICIAKEVKKANDIINEFRYNLKHLKKEAFDKVNEYIRKRCL